MPYDPRGTDTIATRPGLLVAITTAALVGVATMAIAYLAAWRNYGSAMTYHRRFTVSTLERARGELQNYRVKHGVYPERLSDVDPASPPAEDLWGRPLVYTRVDGRYEVLSWGADGRPGGKGLDTDLYGDSRDDPDWQPTLAEYWGRLPSDGSLPLSAAAGAVAGVLAFVLLRARRERPASRAVGIAVTMFLSVVVALMMIAIHVVSSH